MLRKVLTLFFLCLNFSSIFQSTESVAVPPSSSTVEEQQAPQYALKLRSRYDDPNYLKTLTRYKKKGNEPLKYTIKTFFLIDNTTKHQEEEERVKFKEILEGINLKLRTDGKFPDFYFQIEASEVVFQEGFYFNDPIFIAEVTDKPWTDGFPKMHPNRDVHAAMVLSRRSFFNGYSTGPTSETVVGIKRQNHELYWSSYPSLYNKTANPEYFPTIFPLHPYDDYTFYWEKVPTETSRKPEAKDTVSNEKEEPVAPVTKSDDDSRIMGTMRSYSICHTQEHGSGIITGYGDMEFLEVFQGIFVHEFFHGFGLAHDPLFLEKCVGYTMDDGVAQVPPIKFSPCSIEAMYYLLPTFPCIYNQHN